MAILKTELCVGCGKPTRQYDFVGIGNASDFPDAATGEGVKGVDGQSREAFGICAECHHRPTRALKLHYVPRVRVTEYLRAAGATTLGGG